MAENSTDSYKQPDLYDIEGRRVDEPIVSKQHIANQIMPQDDPDGIIDALGKIQVKGGKDSRIDISIGGEPIVGDQARGSLQSIANGQPINTSDDTMLNAESYQRAKQIQKLVEDDAAMLEAARKSPERISDMTFTKESLLKLIKDSLGIDMVFEEKDAEGLESYIKYLNGDLRDISNKATVIYRKISSKIPATDLLRNTLILDTNVGYSDQLNLPYLLRYHNKFKKVNVNGKSFILTQNNGNMKLVDDSPENREILTNSNYEETDSTEILEMREITKKDNEIQLGTINLGSDDRFTSIITAIARNQITLKSNEAITFQNFRVNSLPGLLIDIINDPRAAYSTLDSLEHMTVDDLPSGNHVLSYPSAYFVSSPYIEIAIIPDMAECISMAKKKFVSACTRLGVKYSAALESRGIIAFHTRDSKYIITPDYLEKINDLESLRELVKTLNNTYDPQRREGIDDVFEFPQE